MELGGSVGTIHISILIVVVESAGRGVASNGKLKVIQILMLYLQTLALLQWGQGGGEAMAPSLLSCFSAVSMSWFTFAIASILLCCGPLTCLLLYHHSPDSFMALSEKIG